MEHYLSKLERVFKKDWEKPAISNYCGESFTYSEIAQHIERFHILFDKAGIVEGQHITLCARNCARWAVSFLSINTYKTVVVSLLADFTPDSVAHLVDHSDSVLLFADADIWAKIDPESVPQLKGVIDVATFSLLYARDPELQKAYDNLDQSFNEKFPQGLKKEDVNYPKDNIQDIAVINYTSGTTSAPKGVMLRYECISATVEHGVKYMQPNDGDHMVSMLPMGHIFGMIYEFIYPLCGGADIYYFGKTPSPTLLLKAMKELKPYLVVTVPLVMEKIYKSSILPVISKKPVSILIHIPIINNIIYKKIGKKLVDAFGGNVREFILGGAALNPQVDKIFKKIDLPYTVGYGMTEASPLLAYAAYPTYVTGTCGRPIGHTQIKIDSEDPERIAGEILAKGPNICSGYYKNEEASAAAFTEDGFLRTGDLGTMDAQGNITIRGRSKSMILSANGQNIYPEEVESVVNSQEYVIESVVIDRESKIVALVYLDQDAIQKAGLDESAVAEIPSKIQKESNKVLPNYSQISKVEPVSTPFEKTPKMSIKRFLYK